MAEERRKRPREEDSDEEDPLSKNDPDREGGEDVEPKRPRSTRRCVQNRKPITEEPTDSEEEEDEEGDEEDEEEEEEGEDEYDSEDYKADEPADEEDE